MKTKGFILLLLFFSLILPSINIVGGNSQDHYREVFQTDFSDGIPYNSNYSNNDFNVSLLNETGAYESLNDIGIRFINHSNTWEGKRYLTDGDLGITNIFPKNKGIISQLEIDLNLKNSTVKPYLRLWINNSNDDPLGTIFLHGQNNNTIRIGIGYNSFGADNFIEYITCNHSNMNISIIIHLLNANRIEYFLVTPNHNYNYIDDLITSNTVNDIDICKIDKVTLKGGSNQQDGPYDSEYFLERILYAVTSNFYYESLYDKSGNLWDLGSLGDSSPNHDWSDLYTDTITSKRIYDNSDESPNGFIIPISMPGFDGEFKTFRMLIECEGVDASTTPIPIFNKNKMTLAIKNSGKLSKMYAPSTMTHLPNSVRNHPVYMVIWEDINYKVSQADIPTLNIQFRLLFNANWKWTTNILTVAERDNNIDDFRKDRIESMRWIVSLRDYVERESKNTGVMAYYGWDTDEGDYTPPPPPSEIVITVKDHNNYPIELNQDVKFTVTISGDYIPTHYVFWNRGKDIVLRNPLENNIKMQGKLKKGINDIQYTHVSDMKSGSFTFKVVTSQTSNTEQVDWNSNIVYKKQYTVNNTDLSQDGGWRNKLTIVNKNNVFAYAMNSYAYCTINNTDLLYVKLFHVRENEYTDFNYTLDYNANPKDLELSYYVTKSGWYQWEIYPHNKSGTPEDTARFFVFPNTKSDQNFITSSKKKYYSNEQVRIDYGHTSILSLNDIKIEVINQGYGTTKEFKCDGSGAGHVQFVPDNPGDHMVYFTYNGTLVDYPKYYFRVTGDDEGLVNDFTTSPYGAMIGLGVALSIAFLGFYISHNGTVFLGTFGMCMILFSIPGSPILFFPVQISIFIGLLLAFLFAYMIFFKR